MTLYKPMSDDGFSSLQHQANLFVAGFWQMEETGFHPKYDLSARQPKHDAENRNENGTENNGENSDGGDCLQDDEKLFSDALIQKAADAYAQGYLDGQQAIAAQLDESQERRDALAAAINRLKPADEAKLAKQLWEAVLSLFRQAVGDAKTDRGLLQQRCEAALKSIAAEMGEACLHVAPADVGTLRYYDCAVPVVADPELLPGSVRLSYGSGQITSGSLSIVEEIEAQTGAVDARLGGMSC